MRETDRQFAREKGPTETFRRLHLLTARGYVARLEGWGGVDDAIFLDHLANGPPLILYPDGKIVATGSGNTSINPDHEDSDRIYNERESDSAVFDHFLSTVPQPTWRERSRPAREKYIYTPGCMIVMFGALLMISHFIGKWWQSFWG